MNAKKNENDYLLGSAIDTTFRWPIGHAEKLAKKGKLPHRILPDGSIRFSWEKIEKLVIDFTVPEPGEEVQHA
ncbi:hypothetical protein [Rhodopirellula europaea]|uniref:hypothetical protein n=1 Tax=Rhodopirellula europaea TaxID=1263866 RepID=UPI003D291AEF|tara:strand:- start:4100 stop:4318 length:219 start_codon:yes stop_codon:yes gene_type:complete